MSLPPIPTWQVLHPLVIHFPIALLFVAPVFLLLAVLLPKNSRWLQLPALILMVLGTAMQKYGEKLTDEQEVLCHAADVVMETFAAESALVRALDLVALPQARYGRLVQFLAHAQPRSLERRQPEGEFAVEIDVDSIQPALPF